jgi:hypothetical protein
MERMPNDTILMENALIWTRMLTKLHAWYTSLMRCSCSIGFAPNLKSLSPPCTVKKARILQLINATNYSKRRLRNVWKSGSSQIKQRKVHP